MRTGTAIGVVAAAALNGLFAWLVLTGLGTPLLWYDEADTAMFARRILQYGYPKVHGPRNIVYGVIHPLELGTNQKLDAYIGSPWAQYYFAAPAVAWSNRVSDLHDRTWRVRLPFALAGCLGVLLLLAAGRSLIPGDAGPRMLYAAGAGALLCVSISLQLHLREVRYYPLVVLGLGVIANLLVHRHVRRDLAALPYTLLLALALFWLFNLFYPSFMAVVGTAGGFLAWRALRSHAPRDARLKELMREALPFALACLIVLPVVVFFRIPEQGLAFIDRYGSNVPARLLDAGYYLLRFEFLGPALVGAVALALASRRAGEAAAPLRPTLRACALLVALPLVWVALVSRTPFFFERYCVPLSPLLVGLCILQLACLRSLLRGPARRHAAVGLLCMALALVASIGTRGPELHGRWTELQVPYRGPLDYVIPYLIARYPRPDQLVIATSYEEPSYMFYLGSRTIMGHYTPQRDRDLLDWQPDVIIPRHWGNGEPNLRIMAGRAPYELHTFPIANVRINNIPSLSPHNEASIVHRFVSPRSPEDGEPFQILELVGSDSARLR